LNQRKVFELIGERIADARKALGFNQTEMGKKCGVHRTTIQRIEDGEINVSAWTLIKIAKALHMSPSKIFHGKHWHD
jgi:putative transcriptional regulator